MKPGCCCWEDISKAAEHLETHLLSWTQPTTNNIMSQAAHLNLWEEHLLSYEQEAALKTTHHNSEQKEQEVGRASRSNLCAYMTYLARVVEPEGTDHASFTALWQYELQFKYETVQTEPEHGPSGKRDSPNQSEQNTRRLQSKTARLSKYQGVFQTAPSCHSRNNTENRFDRHDKQSRSSFGRHSL